ESGPAKSTPIISNTEVSLMRSTVNLATGGSTGCEPNSLKITHSYYSDHEIEVQVRPSGIQNGITYFIKKY
ncbi:hypothetical protein NPIL_104491, partial [Nephila pilipes]